MPRMDTSSKGSPKPRPQASRNATRSTTKTSERSSKSTVAPTKDALKATKVGPKATVLEERATASRRTAPPVSIKPLPKGLTDLNLSEDESDNIYNTEEGPCARTLTDALSSAWRKLEDGGWRDLEDGGWRALEEELADNKSGFHKDIVRHDMRHSATINDLLRLGRANWGQEDIRKRFRQLLIDLARTVFAESSKINSTPGRIRQRVLFDGAGRWDKLWPPSIAELATETPNGKPSSIDKRQAWHHAYGSWMDGDRKALIENLEDRRKNWFYDCFIEPDPDLQARMERLLRMLRGGAKSNHLDFYSFFVLVLKDLLRDSPDITKDDADEHRGQLVELQRKEAEAKRDSMV